MKRLAAALLFVGLPWVTGFALAQDAPGPASTQGPTEPIPLDKVETEKVRLIVLDTLVVDSKGRTVPDLTKEDFEILMRGESAVPDTLDVRCEAAIDEPVAVTRAQRRMSPAPPGAGGKIVLAIDYLHLRQMQRAEVLDHALEMVKHGGVDGEEIMIAALNGGLRVEQTFTSDREQIWSSLRRMQHDITLWQPSFFHLNEVSWVEGVTTLFDVLGTVAGPKAVVFFSAMGDVPLDLQFQDIAAHAAASRCSVYSVDARGLTTPKTASAGTVRGVGDG